MEKFDIKNITREFCSIRENRNSIYGSDKLTKRAFYIKSFLKSQGIKVKVNKILDKRAYDNFFGSYEINSFCNLMGYRNKLLYFHNLEVFFKSKNKKAKTVVFTAHHDINNVNSDNFQDNSASVINLMNLCLQIKDLSLENNVLIVFTDCEEFGLRGAEGLCERMKSGKYGEIKYIVNSELTGNGDTVWCESCDGTFGELYDFMIKNNVPNRSCPLNDSYSFRKNGFKSLCFGLLPKEEFESGFPKTWGVCHSERDTIEQANYSNMEMYVDFLKKLL